MFSSTPSSHCHACLLARRFTGTEVVDLVKRGNVIVTSRDRCDEHIELMKKHPDVKEMLSHWHKSVMYASQAGCGFVWRGCVALRANKHRSVPVGACVSATGTLWKPTFSATQ